MPRSVRWSLVWAAADDGPARAGNACRRPDTTRLARQFDLLQVFFVLERIQLHDDLVPSQLGIDGELEAVDAHVAMIAIDGSDELFMEELPDGAEVHDAPRDEPRFVAIRGSLPRFAVNPIVIRRA